MKWKYKVIMGTIIVSLYITATVFAPIIAPNEPYEINMSAILESGSAKYPFGTDQMGRCLFSRILYGGRISLGVTSLVLVLTIFIGLIVGIISGISSGTFLDKFFTSVCEIILAFPGILLALVVAGMLGSGIFNIMISIALIGWAKYARIIRSLVIDIKSADYIKAAKVSGISNLTIVKKHIIPNILDVVATVFVTDIGMTILRISSLSFIGLGVSQPQAEWGMMINDARIFIETKPMMIVYPIITIGLVVFSFHLIGDGLREKRNKNVI